MKNGVAEGVASDSHDTTVDVKTVLIKKIKTNGNTILNLVQFFMNQSSELKENTWYSNDFLIWCDQWVIAKVISSHHSQTFVNRKMPNQTAAKLHHFHPKIHYGQLFSNGA